MTTLDETGSRDRAASPMVIRSYVRFGAFKGKGSLALLIADLNGIHRECASSGATRVGA